MALIRNIDQLATLACIGLPSLMIISLALDVDPGIFDSILTLIDWLDEYLVAIQ
jgi:hypothetical protein